MAIDEDVKALPPPTEEELVNADKISKRKVDKKKNKGGMMLQISLAAFGILCAYAFQRYEQSLPVNRVYELTDQALYKTVIYPTKGFSMGSANNEDVIWAVFFYKPYCGACRRLRPLFEVAACPAPCHPMTRTTASLLTQERSNP